MATNPLEPNPQSTSLSEPGSSLTSDNSSVVPELSPTLSQPEQVAVEQKKSLKTVARVLILALAGLLLLGGLAAVFVMRQGKTTLLQASDFGELKVSLAGISGDLDSSAESLKVNGRLSVSNSVVLSPTAQPDNPLTGQLYYDKASNQLLFYNGTQFVGLQGGSNTQITNNIGGSTGDQITNVFGGGGSNPISLSGTPGSLAMFTGNSSLGDSLISQSGSTLQVGTSSTTSVNVGSGNGASASTLQGGTGGVTLSTGNAAGVSGSVSITTGDSSTTASGNITIDAGEGIVDGEVISDKTFESGLDNMAAWFGSSVAQSSDQAHSGVYSLRMTANDSFWGVEQQILSAIPVTPGHQYYFSAWVRAGSAPRTINTTIVWNGSGGQQVSFTPTQDNASGWTQITATAPAPATATSANWRFSSSGSAIGETHYFDDLTMTDLSSSSAISAISIGAQNAKIVTIGNLNQIGATSIYGSSGIRLNSGAAGTTMQGGVISITGNAASSLSTSNGALSITSADSATWGIGTASTGVGGSLTLRGGNGGSDGNNNGGDVIIQGGNPNGAASAGSVIIRPQTDVSDAFMVQNSASTPLLIADSSAMKITIAGTTATFATLSLDNAHFSSTQTTAPTISTPASCGTTPTAVVTAGSTDVAGSFSITTGTGGSAASCDVTITFNKPYGAAPKSIIVVGRTDAASVARQIYVSSSTATTFTTTFATSAGGADNTTYSFNYWVIE